MNNPFGTLCRAVAGNLSPQVGLLATSILFYITCFVLPSSVYAEDISIDSPQTKIVGGTTAVEGTWPWMAAIVYANQSDLYYGQYCGGALIAKQWVLTAAHCTYDGDGTAMQPSEIDVVMGVHDLSTDTGDRIDVISIVRYPGYNATTDDGDLALLKLSRESSETILPLFTDTSNDLTGTMGTLIGWGSLSAYGSYPTQLQQVQVPIVSNAVCSVSYPGQITDNMVCAGYASGGKDSCSGDSGGPLMVWNDGQWKHAGIVSWGYSCAEPYYYGVNTRTSRFIQFIKTYVPTVDDGSSSSSEEMNMVPIYFLLQ